MISDILTPMNHREIEYNAKKLPGCDIPGITQAEQVLLKWMDETGKRVFDEELVMDYGTDCLRLYLLFEKTPVENDAPYYDSWQEGALEGIYKFLGRYRRMVLTANEWNRRGNYNEDTLSLGSINTLEHELEDTRSKILTYISRGNTMQNRHHIVSAMMELLNMYQKELKIGEIVTALHQQAVAAAVPHSTMQLESDIEQMPVQKQNPVVTKLCMDFILLMMPYVPDLSKILSCLFCGD